MKGSRCCTRPLISFIILLVPWNTFQDVLASKIRLNSNNVDVENLASFAEDLVSAQYSVSDDAAIRAQEKYAQASSYWAQVARKFTMWKATEAMEITRKAQEAQILSLKFGSIASRLKSAVMSAQIVFNSVFERYKTLSALSAEAENYSSQTKKALNLMQFIQARREKWAIEERARALRLSQQLQNILFDLKTATEWAQSANEYEFAAQMTSL